MDVERYQSKYVCFSEGSLSCTEEDGGVGATCAPAVQENDMKSIDGKQPLALRSTDQRYRTMGLQEAP